MSSIKNISNIRLMLYVKKLQKKNCKKKIGKEKLQKKNAKKIEQCGFRQKFDFHKKTS